MSSTVIFTYSILFTFAIHKIFYNAYDGDRCFIRDVGVSTVNIR